VVPSVCIVAADLSELEASAAGLRQSNAELQKSAMKLRSLAGELARTEERERRRLASILHDELQQLLVGAQIRLDMLLAESALDMLLAETAKDLLPTVQSVVELLGQSIAVSRTLATEISPPIRLGSGLLAAFEWLVRSMYEKHSLAVKITVRGAVDPVSEETAILLFRSVQELLFNVVKHAGVNAADLTLETDRDHLRITVSDKGKGFDAAKVERASGFGLFSIRERLSLVGGGMETWSEPGRGSGLTLVVPLAALRSDSGRPASMRRAARKAGSPRKPAARRPEERRPIRIVVVDDHKVTREGLVLLLSKETDFRIVGECDDGEAAVRIAGEVEPDIVMMDVSMSGMNGIDATRAIHAQYPGICIIGLSMLDAAGTGAAMKEAGAAAFVSKSMSPRLLVQSIRALAPTWPQPG
jgi:CheY-like chemotaxis protein